MALLIQNHSYTKEEIQNEFHLDDDKASNLIRKLEQMGYKATGNGRKGKNYRIIITALPQMANMMKLFNSINLNYSDNNLTKIAQLLSSLGTEANYSYSSLENYNYFTDKTIKKYLEIFEKIGVVKMNFTSNIYYATKKRILTYQEVDYTPEEIEKQDYYYVVDVKKITEEEYMKAVKVYNEFKEENKDSDMVPDELEFYAFMEKRRALDGWNPKKNSGERYEINDKYPLIDTITSLLDKNNYQRIKKGNHIDDELKWWERQQKWEEEREMRKQKEDLIKQIELLKSMLTPEELDRYNKMIESEE